MKELATGGRNYVRKYHGPTPLQLAILDLARRRPELTHAAIASLCATTQKYVTRVLLANGLRRRDSYFCSVCGDSLAGGVCPQCSESLSRVADRIGEAVAHA